MKSSLHLHHSQNTFGLEPEFQESRLVFTLKCHAVVIAGQLQYLSNVFNGQTQSQRFVACVVTEYLLAKEKGDQCNVTTIHGLNRETLCVNLDVHHLHQLLQGIDNLPE